MTNIKNLVLGTFAACMAFLTGCSTSSSDKANESLSNCEDYVFSDSISSTHVYGFVNDIDGNALSDIKVTSGKDTVLTSENGAYSLNRCHAVNGKCAIKFEGDEYFSVIRTATIADGEARVDAILMPQDSKEGVTEVTRFYNKTGATIEVGKMKIAIPANSLVYESDGKEFNGSVFASTYYLNPNSEDFTKQMPGGDMSGVTEDGKSVILLSYGMVEVSLKDSANQKLQLKSGTESTLSFPIPDGYTEEQKYKEIPLWYFDEEKGTWIEEGIATKNGDSYTGKVKHFSWHNLDYPNSRASICGRVTNKSGVPLPNVLVTISQTSARTDKDGYYCAYVPQNTPVFVTVKPSDYANYTNCPIYKVNGLEARSEYTQDIVLPDMPSIHGKVFDKEGNTLAGIEVLANKSKTSTNRNGEYLIYYRGDEAVTLKVSENSIYNGSKSKAYTFKDPSEIVDTVSYDFTITRPITIWGWIRETNSWSINKDVVVTVVVDGKEYRKKSKNGSYTFKVSSDAKEVTTYVKAADGYGEISNKSSRTINGNYSWNHMSTITVPSGITIRGSIVNTCGPSKANVSIETGRGKNKEYYSKTSKYGYFYITLPLTMKGSKAKVKINCQGKRITKKIDLANSYISLGNIEICAGEKPEPNCIYAIINDKTVKFDTEKDKYTEMFQRVKYSKENKYKYQAWYKNPNYNAALVLEIKSSNKDKKMLSVHLIADGISASNWSYAKTADDSIYKFKPNYELTNEQNDDDDLYIYGEADIKEQSIESVFDNTYIASDIKDKSTNLLVGKSNSSSFQTITIGKESTQTVEKSLKSKGFKEKTTFMDDEQRISSLYAEDNAQAIIHRNKDNSSELTILKRDGIGQEPLYQCWKVDFKKSSLKKKGGNVDYMWKNETDIAQMIMFGPLMGVSFTKTNISEQKCGCTTNSPAVAN